MCILSAYTLLNVAGYNDLSVVLSMSVIVFQNKVGWAVSSIQVVFDFWNV